MTWVEAINWFAWGFVMGYAWNPVWRILKKIYSEAKKAREEW